MTSTPAGALKTKVLAGKTGLSSKPEKVSTERWPRLSWTSSTASSGPEALARKPEPAPEPAPTVEAPEESEESDDDEAEDDRCRHVAHPAIQGQPPQRLPRHHGQALDRRLRQRAESGEDEQEDGHAGQESQAHASPGGQSCLDHWEGLGDGEAGAFGL